jgi:hypothetical protein
MASRAIGGQRRVDGDRFERQRVMPKAGECAYSLAASKCCGAQTLEIRTECLGGARGVQCPPELRLDLIFAERHRVEAAGDTQRVTHGVLIEMDVGTPFQRGDVYPGPAGEPLQHVCYFQIRRQNRVDLGAIARGQDQGLGGNQLQLRERRLPLGWRNAEALQQLERGSGMARARDDDSHADQPSRSEVACESVLLRTVQRS